MPAAHQRAETKRLMACQDELVSVLPQGGWDSGDTGNDSLQSEAAVVRVSTEQVTHMPHASEIAG